VLDADVPEVEALLTAAAARRPAPVPTPGGPRLPVTHALAICACVTHDDAPTWLLYATADRGFGWLRDPDGDEPLVRVDAESSAAEHAAPSDVLAWLRGSTSGSFGDGGHELRSVLDALAQVITAGRRSD